MEPQQIDHVAISVGDFDDVQASLDAMMAEGYTADRPRAASTWLRP
jgi:hypothetical protein